MLVQDWFEVSMQSDDPSPDETVELVPGDTLESLHQVGPDALSPEHVGEYGIINSSHFAVVFDLCYVPGE